LAYLAFGIKCLQPCKEWSLSDKNFSGPEKFFQVQPSKTELRVRYFTMPGLESSFWPGIRFRKELVGKKTGAGLPNRAKGQIFHHARA